MSFPAPDPENLSKLARVLKELDAQVEGAGELGGLTLKIVSYDGLVELKEQAGRPQDAIDLQRLREARAEE